MSSPAWFSARKRSFDYYTNAPHFRAKQNRRGSTRRSGHASGGYFNYQAFKVTLSSQTLYEVADEFPSIWNATFNSFVLDARGE